MASAVKAIAAVTMCAVSLSIAIPAQAAAPTARICRSGVTLRDSPQGFVIGYLRRGERVRRLPSSDRRWARVDTAIRVRGWVPRAALCGH